MVQAGLRFFASNSKHNIIGDVIGMHKSSSCKVVHEFTDAIIRHKNEFIKMPETREERDAIKGGFFELARMPGDVGCIDGTHIRISSPSENEADFVNRKGFHSINVQAICERSSSSGH